jgi:hypothetical protein
MVTGAPARSKVVLLTVIVFAGCASDAAVPFPASTVVITPELIAFAAPDGVADVPPPPPHPARVRTAATANEIVRIVISLPPFHCERLLKRYVAPLDCPAH